MKKLKKKKRPLGKMASVDAKPRTVRSAMEKEQAKRDKYFRDALAEFDTEPFFSEWTRNSKRSLGAVLAFLARSYGVVEGFELTNRALRQNMKMDRAGVDISAVVDFSKRASRIAFFDFVLSHNDLSPDARKLTLAMFIAKEFGYEKISAERALERALDGFAENVKQGPIPRVQRQRKTEKPAKRSISTPRPRPAKTGPNSESV